jgi:ferredoxin
MEAGAFPKYFLRTDKLRDFLAFLDQSYSVYVPLDANGVLHYGLFDPEGDQKVLLGGSHATEPLKSFFFPAHEIVGTYFTAGPSDEGGDDGQVAIVGVKSHDLRSLKLLDLIFSEGEFLDTTYVKKREKALIIASDCTSFSDACFSPLVDVKLYPEDHFDLAFGPVKGGFVVEVGSEKGGKTVEGAAGLFTDAPPEKVSERDANREALEAEAEKQAAEYKIDRPYEDLLRQEIDSPVWKETTKTCVECGACVLVCPTCYCFVLADRKSGEGFERTRTWDTCQFKGFARVAGGANPRERLAERLRHRYLHKFDYLKESYDFYACTGCGRCVQACMGKIDMRKVLVELAQAATRAK